MSRRELSLVIPTLNEKPNIEPLLEKLRAVLMDIDWEVIFVDDASSDGTGDLIDRLSEQDPRIKLLRREGKRGLSSACLEGMEVSRARILGIMDADLQHDETILPQLVAAIRDGADIAVGSRYVAGGGFGAWSWHRRMISKGATTLTNLVLRQNLSDPMSGFFLISRNFYQQTAADVTGTGFKILLDFITSTRNTPKIVEAPYVFRTRLAGESKLSPLVAFQFLLLLIQKRLAASVPLRFLSFAAIGASGVLIHLAILALLHRALDIAFWISQASATGLAMIWNFHLNNFITHCDRRLRGRYYLKGLVGFMLVCALGAIANIGTAEFVRQRFDLPWYIAGGVGVVIGAVWNYAVSATFVWRSKDT